MAFASAEAEAPTSTEPSDAEVGLEAYAEYEVRADAPERLTLLRRPAHYTRLAAGNALGSVAATVAGSFEVVLDRAGHLERIDGDEKLTAARTDGELALRQNTRIKAWLLSIARGSPGPEATERLAGLSSTGLGDVTSSAEAGQRLLKQRAGDLTMDRLTQALLIHGPATTFPDASRWMWQATGFLLLHPDRCRGLVQVFRAPQLNHRARACVLDLLASTGSPEAQAVLRELLDTGEAKGSDRYTMLVQRLSLVAHPTEETLGYLRAKVEQGGANTLAVAHALGAAVGHQAQGAKVDERSAAVLRQGLAAARSSEQRVGWLGALGNAGLAEDVPRIAGYATNDDPAVRGAAAHALRKTQTPASERILLGLAGDVDSGVRDRALHTLTQYSLAPAELDTLRRYVSSGRLEPANFVELMTVALRNRHQPQGVLPLLEAMLAQEISDRRLRIRNLHATLANPGTASRSPNPKQPLLVRQGP